MNNYRVILVWYCPLCTNLMTAKKKGGGGTHNQAVMNITCRNCAYTSCLHFAGPVLQGRGEYTIAVDADHSMCIARHRKIFHGS